MEQIFKEGDVFAWAWTNTRIESHRKFWGDTNLYHCKSRIATYNGNILRDTFWGSNSEGHLDPADIVLTYRGNINEMTVIPSCETEFYRSEDIVDMRHSNSSREVVYRKPGTDRDPEMMRAYFKRKIEDADREIRWAHDRQGECHAALSRIESGDTAGYFPVWSR